MLECLLVLFATVLINCVEFVDWEANKLNTMEYFEQLQLSV